MRLFLILLLVFLVLVGGMTCTANNSLVAKEEQVAAAWSEIDNQYKRRMDMIPQLVKTVEGVADYEQSTLEAVVDARASVGRVQLPEGVPNDPQKLEAYMAAQRGLGGALGRLFAVAENYPTLRATESFLSLQDQIEGTENRIAVARGDYIRSVQIFNTSLRQFPTNLMAGFLGLQRAETLPAEDGARETPDIKFGSDG
ncbi:MAG: LemA family protein [Planctomycetota bacterium]|jgi:LemA protein|nr:LemA family protein [Planctomycetota bacterium]